MHDACTVCSRPDRAEVDAALARGDAIAATARRFGIVRTTLQRHAKHYRSAEIPPTLPPEAPPVEIVPPVEVTPLDVPVIDRRTGRPLPAVPPEVEEAPRIEVDEALLGFLAEQAEQARRDGSIATRERPGARRTAREARREQTSLLAERLHAQAEAWLEEAGDEKYADDLSGRARLITACNAAVSTVARLRGELDPEAARDGARVEAILDVLEAPEHAAAAKAVLVRLEAMGRRS